MTIYQGNCLRVDLTNHKIEREKTPANGIGARSWNSAARQVQMDLIDRWSKLYG